MDTDAAAQSAATANLHKCTNCGASLTFSPGAQSLKCESCGAENTIDAQRSAIIENDFVAFLEKSSESAERLSISVVKCDSCGASTTFPPNVTAGNCPYCDAPLVIQNATTCDVIKPAYILPFRVERRAARDAFVKWVHGLWFAPGRLAEYAKHSVEKLRGVYLPYWTYDALTITAYTGQRGEYYYVTETYRDAQGETKTRQVRKTRWYSARGTVTNAFDDVLVCASNALPKRLVNDLEPWDLGELVDYNDHYLAGFVTESYEIGLKEGFEHAADRMRPVIERSIEQDIGGDEQRISSMNTTYLNVSFKHILLPLWISAYRYQDKVYRFTVNARTGEISGERPYSAWKILFAVILVAGIAAGVAYLGKGYWW